MGKKGKSERARLAEEILAAYQPETVAEMQDALKPKIWILVTR